MNDVRSGVNSPVASLNHTVRNVNRAEEVTENHQQNLNPGDEAMRNGKPAEGGGIPHSPVHQDSFDQEGLELDSGARVWKTYVKEATQYDSELAKEWNGTLDVMLAIVTTFLNESSKKLQEDYVETSARTLSFISQTLVAISEGRQLPQASQTTSERYQPARLDVCVNILWFVSLSLSVAVSFIAILAKEWCFNLTSGDPDEPYPQARKRQIRWNGVTKWRMTQLMIVLPSVLYISLLLFAAGLCINLWTLNFVVALPVVIISSTTGLVYVLSTMAHLIFSRCPYSTAASRLIRGAYMKVGWTGDKYEQHIKQEHEQDKITSQSIAWMIRSSQNRGSVDIALQAIAGADKNLPRDALIQCGAINLIKVRLNLLGIGLSGISHAGDSTTMRIQKLYIRALEYLQAIPLTGSAKKQADLESKLKSRIRKLRGVLESVITRHIALEGIAAETLSSDKNICALKAATRAIMESYWIRDRGLDQSSLEAITNELESYQRNPDSLHPASADAVVTGAATLYSCTPRNNDSDAAVRYILRALPEHNQPANDHLGIILASFALSRCDDPNLLNHEPTAEIEHVLSAVETITSYLARINAQNLHSSTITTMARYGLSHLLQNSQRYNLSAQELERVYMTFNCFPNDVEDDSQILDLPESNIDIHEYILSGLTNTYAHTTAFGSSTTVPLTLHDRDSPTPGIEADHLGDTTSLVNVSRSPADTTESMHADLAIILLQQATRNRNKSPKIIEDLTSALTKLFPVFLPHCAPTKAGQLIDLLLSDDLRIPTQNLALLIVVFSFSWNDFPAIGPAHLSRSLTGASRARLVAHRYTPLLRRFGSADASVMISIGLLGLIDHPQLTKLKPDILQRVYASFVPLATGDDDPVTFDGAPINLNVHNYIADVLNNQLVTICQGYNIHRAEEASTIHLITLSSIYTTQLRASPPTSELVVVEPALHNQATPPRLEDVFAWMARLNHAPAPLPIAVVYSFTIGSSILLACSVLHRRPAAAAHLIIQSLSGQYQPSRRCLGILLLSFALSRNGPPGWFDQPSSPEAPVLRALKAIVHYAPKLSELHGDFSTFMINIGLLELFINSSEYEISGDDLRTIYTTYTPVQNTTSTEDAITHFLQAFGSCLHSIEEVNHSLSVLERLEQSSTNDTRDIIGQHRNPATPRRPSSFLHEQSSQHMYTHRFAIHKQAGKIRMDLLWPRHMRELQRSIRSLKQNTDEAFILTLGITTQLPLSQMEQLSLEIGNRIEELCLNAVVLPGPTQNQVPDMLYSLRYRLRHGRQTIQPAVASTLVIWMAMLSSCTFPSCEPTLVARFVLGVLSSRGSIPNDHFSLFLIAFAVAMSDLPAGSTQAPREVVLARASNALAVITNYAPQLGNFDISVSETMISLGLLELIKLGVNHFTETEIGRICEAFVPLPYPEMTPILHFSPTRSIHERLVGIFRTIILTTNEQSNRSASRAVSFQLLVALQRVYPLLRDPEVGEIVNSRLSDSEASIELVIALVARAPVIGSLPVSEPLLPPGVVDLITIGIATIIGATSVDCNPPTARKIVKLLLQSINGPWHMHSSHNLALLFTTFALSKRDYPGWIRPVPLNPDHRAMRTREVIAGYVQLATTGHRQNDVSDTSFALGLLELVAEAVKYGLDLEDFEIIGRYFTDLDVDTNTNSSNLIPTMPASFNIRLHAWESVAHLLEERGSILPDHPTVRLTLLRILLWSRYKPDSPNIIDQVYAFAIESVSPPWSHTAAHGQIAALDILQELLPPPLSVKFPALLSQRGTITKLHKLAGSNELCDEIIVPRIFAIGQLALFAKFATQADPADLPPWLEAFRDILNPQSLRADDDLEASKLYLGNMGLVWEERYRTIRGDDWARRHPYFAALEDALSLPSPFPRAITSPETHSAMAEASGSGARIDTPPRYDQVQGDTDYTIVPIPDGSMPPISSGANYISESTQLPDDGGEANVPHISIPVHTDVDPYSED